MITRKIINIAAANDRLCALCDDGSVWVKGTNASHAWERYPDIPQQKEDVSEPDTSKTTN